MTEERNIEFKELPNTYKIFTDKVNILDRKVLFEKTKKSDEVSDSSYSNYFFNFVEADGNIPAFRNRMIDIREELEKTRVLIEKNIHLIYNKREIKKIRNERYEIIRMYLKNIKSNKNDTVLDITSLENIDFERPCTKEEKIELTKQFDYYVYPESIDEIECEIKEKDSDGVDYARLEYGGIDDVSTNITKNFTLHQTKRLPDDYEEQVKNKVDTIFSNAIKRRVLFEKIGYQTYITMQRYDAYVNSVKERHDSWELRKSYRESNNYLMNQEKNEIVGDLHRMLNDE